MPKNDGNCIDGRDTFSTPGEDDDRDAVPSDPDLDIESALAFATAIFLVRSRAMKSARRPKINKM